MGELHDLICRRRSHGAGGGGSIVVLQVGGTWTWWATLMGSDLSVAVQMGPEGCVRFSPLFLGTCNR